MAEVTHTAPACRAATAPAMACWSATTMWGAKRATALATPGNMASASGRIRSSQTNFIAAGPCGGGR